MLISSRRPERRLEEFWWRSSAEAGCPQLKSSSGGENGREHNVLINYKSHLGQSSACAHCSGSSVPSMPFDCRSGGSRSVSPLVLFLVLSLSLSLSGSLHCAAALIEATVCFLPIPFFAMTSMLRTRHSPTTLASEGSEIF